MDKQISKESNMLLDSYHGYAFVERRPPITFNTVGACATETANVSATWEDVVPSPWHPERKQLPPPSPPPAAL
jgi:hypothetical protein